MPTTPPLAFSSEPCSSLRMGGHTVSETANKEVSSCTIRVIHKLGHAFIHVCMRTLRKPTANDSPSIHVTRITTHHFAERAEDFNTQTTEWNFAAGHGNN